MDCGITNSNRGFSNTISRHCVLLITPAIPPHSECLSRPINPARTSPVRVFKLRFSVLHPTVNLKPTLVTPVKMSKSFPVEVLLPRHWHFCHPASRVLSFCIPPKPCWTLVSIFPFSVTDCLTRENLLQNVHWLFLILVLCFFFSVVTCRALPSTPNSVRYGCTGNSSEFPYDNVCSLSCIDGFRAIGSSVRRCQQNGLWSGEEFSCQRKYKGG